MVSFHPRVIWVCLFVRLPIFLGGVKGTFNGSPKNDTARPYMRMGVCVCVKVGSSQHESLSQPKQIIPSKCGIHQFLVRTEHAKQKRHDMVPLPRARSFLEGISKLLSKWVCVF